MQADPKDVLATAVCLSPLVVALVLAFRSGGFFITSWGVAAIVLLGVLAAAALVFQSGWGGVAGATALAGWIGLAAWQGLSQAWAPEPAAATEAMNLTILYGSAFAVVLVGLREIERLRWLLDGCLIVTALVAGWGIGARLLPDLIGSDLDARLSTPISYWNGLGAVMAFGIVLGIGVGASSHRPSAVRALAAGLVPLFGAALLFTLSRGAFVALAVGLLGLLALARGRVETLVIALLAIGSTLPVIVAAQSADLVSLNEVPRPQGGEGVRVLVVLVVCMAVSGLLTLAATAGLGRLGRAPRLAIGSALGGSLALAVLLAAFALPSGGPIAWGDRQFESFRSYGGGDDEIGGIEDRLADAAGSGRWQQWTVAFDDAQAHPAAGSGAGSYRFVWNADRPIDQTVQNAHSLYLEVLSETGIVGLALLVVPIAAGAVVILMAIGRRPESGSRDIGVAAAAAGVIAVHAAGDWDWQLPAVMLPAIALGAGALKASSMVLSGESDRDASAGTWRGWLVLIIAVGALPLLVGGAASAHALNSARADAADGRLDTALRAARDAGTFAPQSPRPPLLEGLILADLGDFDAADRAFAAAHVRSPQDWSVLADWSAVLLARGDTAAARSLAERARAVNPREERVQLLIDATEAPPR